MFIEQEETNGISGDSNIWYKGLIIFQNEYSEIAERVRMYIRSKMGDKTKILMEKGELLQLLPIEKQFLLSTL